MNKYFKALAAASLIIAILLMIIFKSGYISTDCISICVSIWGFAAFYFISKTF